MIKIKIEAANGQDLRAQLLALLFDGNQTVQSIIPSLQMDATDVFRHPVLGPVTALEKHVNKEPATEAPAKKRRSKAEIEADRLAQYNAENAASNHEGLRTIALAEEAAKASTGEDNDDTDATGATDDQLQENKEMNAAADTPAVKIDPELLRKESGIKTAAGKKKEVLATLAKYGVTRITELKSSQYADYLTDIQAL